MESLLDMMIEIMKNIQEIRKSKNYMFVLRVQN